MEIKEKHNCSRELVLESASCVMIDVLILQTLCNNQIIPSMVSLICRLLHQMSKYTTSKIFWPYCGMVVSPLPSLLVQTRPHKLDDDRHHLLNFHFFFLVAKLTRKIATHNNFFKNHKMLWLSYFWQVKWSKLAASWGIYQSIGTFFPLAPTIDQHVQRRDQKVALKH